jgi:multicomponent Na+:H+ antiporter subunit G
MELIGHVLALCGAVFVLIGTIGIIRFPDVFSRMHAAGLADGLGVLLVLVGLALAEGFSTASARMLLIIAFVWLTSTTACHALARNAITAGVTPQTTPEPEDSDQP